MQAEIEAKFLDVDHDEIRDKLKALGAKLEQPMRTMHRAIIDYPDRRLQTQNDGWIRVRDEGDKVTLVYKESSDSTIDAVREIEVVVDSYANTVELLKRAGLAVESEQDTRRETWLLDGCNVELDEWPWLKPYIEIEGADEESIRTVAEKLGFDWSTAYFGSITVAYRVEYPGIKGNETVGMIRPGMYFDQPIPQWLEDRR